MSNQRSHSTRESHVDACFFVQELKKNKNLIETRVHLHGLVYVLRFR